MAKLRAALFISTFSLSLVAGGCTDKGSPGGSDSGAGADSGGPTDPFLDACYELCDAQAQGENCDTDTYKDYCRASCDEPLVDLSECEDEALSAWACMDDQEWICDGTIIVDDIDMPQLSDPSACTVELDAFEVCLFPPEPTPTQFHGRGLFCEETDLHGLTWLAGPSGTATTVRLDLVDPARGLAEHHFLTETGWNEELDETTWELAVPIVGDPSTWSPNGGTANDCWTTWTEKWSAMDAGGNVLTCAVYADTTGVFAGQGCDEWEF